MAGAEGWPAPKEWPLSLSLGRVKEGQCEDWEGAEVCPRVRGVNIEKAA